MISNEAPLVQTTLHPSAKGKSPVGFQHLTYAHATLTKDFLVSSEKIFNLP